MKFIVALLFVTLSALVIGNTTAQKPTRCLDRPSVFCIPIVSTYYYQPESNRCVLIESGCRGRNFATETECMDACVTMESLPAKKTTTGNNISRGCVAENGGICVNFANGTKLKVPGKKPNNDYVDRDIQQSGNGILKLFSKIRNYISNVFNNVQRAQH